MDTLTHVLSGALSGRCLSNKARKTSTKAFIFAGALAALFPDLDIVMKFISDEFYLLNHRSFSHAFILLPIFALLISSFCAFIFTKKIIFKNGWIEEGTTFKDVLKELYPISLIGLFIHVCGDIITSFGTIFLFPFSNTRFEIGSVFIIDLIFTGIIILGLVLSAKEKTPQKKILIGRIFMAALIAYISFTQVLKIQAVSNVEKNPEIIGEVAKDLKLKSVPQMLSPFEWVVIGKDEANSDYYLVKMNLLQNKEKWEVSKHHIYGTESPEKAKKALEDEAYKDYVWFLTDPVYQSSNDECVFFQKAQNISRYRNPFVYGFCEKNGNKYVIKKK